MSREICQWWHFDTNTDLTISDDKVVAQLPKNAKIEITSSSSNDDVHYTKYKGYESDDKLIGWVSKKYLEYEPTPTLSISSTLNKATTILTRFKLDADLSDESDLLLKGSEVNTKHNKIASYLRE